MKGRKGIRRSTVWLLPSDEFKHICETSPTFGAILRHFDLKNHGGNAETIRRRAAAENVDVSHIVRGLGSNKGKVFPGSGQTPFEDLFVENSQQQRSIVRRRILKENLIPYICKECGQEPYWKNKPLSLVLDHENGINNDHRLNNLRFLCPNCNSQTDTFCGKNKRNIAPSSKGKTEDFES